MNSVHQVCTGTHLMIQSLWESTRSEKLLLESVSVLGTVRRKQARRESRFSENRLCTLKSLEFDTGKF